MRFLFFEQLLHMSPRNGPDTGGTLIEVIYEDIPQMNNLDPQTFCVFPGNVQ